MAKDDRTTAADVSSSRVAILLHDADPLARAVVRHELERRDAFAVVAESDTVDQLLALCAWHAPDVVVIEPPADATPDLIRRLRDGADPPRVVAFSLTDDDDVALAAVRAGADGYVPKSAGAATIAAAVTAVVRGEVAISRTVAMRIIETLRDSPGGGHGLRPVRSDLTDREWEVLDMIARGCSTREMSGSLVLSEMTIYSHVKSILHKLGVHSRVEAVARARELRAPLVGDAAEL